MEKEDNILKQFRSFPLFLSILLVAQLLYPVLGVFAADLQVPTNVRYSEVSPGMIKLEWDSVANSKSYRIYKLTGEKKELLSEATSNTAYLNLLEGDYTVAVTSVISNNESTLSEPVTIKIVYPEMQPPKNVTANVVGVYDLKLSWEKADHATQYNIYKISDGTRKLVATTVNTSIDFYTMPEGRHVYEVTSRHTKYGESVQSPQVEVDIVYPEILPPSNTNFAITSGNNITLSWEKANYANKYIIYQITNGERKLVTSTGNLNVTLTNMPKGHYVYEVSTQSYAFGESKTGSRIEFDLVYPEMQAPSNFTISFVNGNDVALKWNGAEYANKYNIYQVKNGERVLLKSTVLTKESFTNLPEGHYIYELNSFSDRFGESSKASRIEFDMVYPEMKNPVGLTGTVQNINNLLLKWDAVEYAAGYKVYEIVNNERKLIADMGGATAYLSNLSQGNHVYEVTSYSNRFGESALGSRIEKEIKFPEMLAPQNIGIFANQDNKAIALWWDPVEYATGYNIYQVVDGERKLVTNVAHNTTTTLSKMPAGEYVFEITAYSEFGESLPSEQVEANIEPDLEAPTNPVTIIEGDDVNLSWEPVEGADSYNVYEIIDGEKVLVGNTEDPSIKIEDLESGDHEFEIVPVDESGVEGSESTTVTVEKEDFDVTAPVTTANVTDEWQTEDITVKFSATDDKSGVDKTFYSIDGAGSVEGTEVIITEEGIHTVYFYSIDKAGNTEKVQTAEVKIDKVAPETKTNVQESWLNEAFTLELTATDDLSGVAKTYYSVNDGEFVEGTTLEVNDAGITKVSFYSVDNAGNVEEAKTIEVKNDVTAPETTSNVTDAWFNQAFTVELSATDDLSGVAKTFYSINDGEYVEGTSFELTEAGVHTVKFYSVDNAGNKEEAKTVEVKIDEVAPETTSNVEDAWLNQAFTVELTATDDQSGVAKTYYSINDGEYAEGTSFELTEAGVHTVKFYSVDNAGNEEEAKTVEVKIDEVAPETTSNVEDTWLNQAFTIELTATDDLSGVAKTYYSINDGEYVEGTSFELTEAGVHTVKFYSVDNAGNKEEAKTVEVKIDEVAPETTSNVTDSWFNQAFKVELTATDDLSGVAKTYYSINDGEYAEGTSFELTEAGVHTVKFYSVDNAGNEEEAKTVEVKIDEADPVTASNVKDGWITQDFTVELTATDDQSGVAKTFYSINGGQYVEGTSFKVSEEGIHKVSYYSVDQAGNVEEAKTVEVKVDKSAPVVAWKIGGGSVDTGSNSSSCQCGFGLWYSPYTPGLNYVACVIQRVFFPWWYNGSSYGSAPTENIVELGDELELGTTLTINYDAADALSGIAAEELTVNGKKIAKGEKVTFDKTGENIIQLTVTDKAGLKTTLTKSFVVYIPGELEITPGIIKGNKGEFTARVSLPKGNRTNFDLGSVTLNGVKAVDKGRGSDQQASQGMFKFNRQDFDWNRGEVSVEFRGTVNGQLVIARTTVTVK